MKDDEQQSRRHCAVKLIACGGHKWSGYMPGMENQLMARLTIIAITASLIGGGIAWLDGRHASASDVSQLRLSIDKERLDRIEFEIEELERTVRGIKRTSELNQREPHVQTRLEELRSRKERYLRKREELLLEMGEN